MVEKDKNRISRRKVLQMSGVGTVAFTGKSIAGKAEAKRENKETRARLKPSVHRVSKKEQNVPKFTNDGKIGFAKGGLKNSITKATIRKLYSEVIGPNLDKNRVALPKPVNQEHNISNQKYKLSNIIGIVVSIEKGGPYIQTRRAPTGLGSMPEREIKQIETKTHEKIDSIVKSHKGQAGLDGGLKYE